MSSDLTGIHKITFLDILARHGWDLAYDLDGYAKTIDRPLIPRLLPHIRLNREGHPATATHEETGRQIPKTLASLMCPNFCVVKAIYDPNYDDPDYRYRLVQFGDIESKDSGREDDCSTYGSLEYLLKAFCKEWIDDQHLDCWSYRQLHVRNGPQGVIPQSYKDKGYGSFA